MTASGKPSSMISQGILNLPGTTFETRRVAEHLLEEDRRKHHCFWGRVGFHNHLSHHILAAYDLGATATLLKKIYELEAGSTTAGIHEFGLKDGQRRVSHSAIELQSWTQNLGNDVAYAAYVEFFEEQVATRGVGETLEKYIFSSEANISGVYMLLRFVAGIMHPLIQTGYGVEFRSDAMVAQALAQTAIHKPFWPEIFDIDGSSPQTTKLNSPNSEHRQPQHGYSLLSILRHAYDSDVLKPVMPYDPDAFISKRFKDACSDGRLEEIRRLAALWQIDDTSDPVSTQTTLDEKVEELIWTVTLLLIGSGRRGRKPRLDFFLMHLLNASLFLPSLLATIPSLHSKIALLKSFVPTQLLTLLIRGRPRIDAVLAMSYTNVPRPPRQSTSNPESMDEIGSPSCDEDYNPWSAIVASVIHAPDAHTLKAIRLLYYGAQQYGCTPPGGAIGAFDEHGRETHPGMAKVDGSLFVRAAGVVMDALGWVTYGQKAGSWDRSALGWDDAWKDCD